MHNRLVAWALMFCGTTLFVLAPNGVCAAKEGVEPKNEVEVVHADGRVFYKYVDENGDIVFEDRPPPQYFDVELEEEEVELPQMEVSVDTVLPPAPTGRWLRLVMLLLVPVLFLVGLYVLLQPRVRRLLTESSLDRKLRHANMPCFNRLQLSDGARTQIEADKVVKTPSGILVIGVEKLSGTITGTAEQREWHRAGRADSFTFANPLMRVEYATQIVQKLVGETPVFGRVIYSGDARFSNGLPAKVTRMSAFQEGIDHFSKSKVGSDQLDAAWRSLMVFPRSNKEPNRLLGIGWLGWLRRHWRETTSGVLVAISIILSIVVLFAFD